MTLDWQALGYRLVSTFQRHERPEPLPVVLHAKRVYVLPTRFGVFFGLFTLVMVTASLNYNNNMALMLTFLIGGFVLLVPLYTVRNLVDLRINHVTAEPVFAGQAATFVLDVVNDHSKPRHVIWAEGDGRQEVTDIPGSGRSNLCSRRPTARRGWMPMPRTRLLTRFPAGLFFAWAWVEPAARVLVYPAPEASAPPLPQGLDPGSGRPERAGDEEWSGLRDYRPGDPSRWIAWKAAARTGELVTKTFARHESERVDLDYAALTELDPERRLSRLARWVLDAADGNLLYSLRLPGRRIGPGTGEVHRHACLRALAEFSP